MDLGPNTTSTLVVVALAVAVLALAIAVGGYRRLSGIQARYRILWTGGEKDLVAVLSHQSAQIVNLHAELDRIRSQSSRTAAEVEQSLRHVAVVRYDASGGVSGGVPVDAPGDIAGELSFSAAITNDHGDGLVISSIHARGQHHSSAKDVVLGISAVMLTPQEQQALAAARTGKGPE